MAVFRIVDSSGTVIGVTGSPLITAPIDAVPAIANIVSGRATADAATIITIPAGRTWKGKVTLAASLSAALNTAAVAAVPTVSIAGAGATPAAGAILGRPLHVPLSTATATNGSYVAGTADTDLIVTAPAGNAVTLTLQLGGATAASATAAGVLL